MIASEKQEALAEAKAITPHSDPQHQLKPRWLKVPAAVAYSSVGRSTLYELMNAGKVRSHRIGAARVIDRESLDSFIAGQPSS